MNESAEEAMATLSKACKKRHLARKLSGGLEVVAQPGNGDPSEPAPQPRASPVIRVASRAGAAMLIATVTLAEWREASARQLFYGNGVCQLDEQVACPEDCIPPPLCAPLLAAGEESAAKADTARPLVPAADTPGEVPVPSVALPSWLPEGTSNTVRVTDSAPCALSTTTGMNHGSWDGLTRTCTLTGPLMESVEVVADDVTLDCAGHGVTSPSGPSLVGTGIRAVSRSRIAVRNCPVGGFSNGMFVQSVTQVTLEGNLLEGNAIGLQLIRSTGANLSQNAFAAISSALVLIAYTADHYEHSIDTTNTIHGRPIYYVRDAADTIFDASTNAATFYCIRCSNVTIRDLSLERNYTGLLLFATAGSRIERLSLRNNSIGIDARASSGNVFSHNSGRNNTSYGIALDAASNDNILIGNQMLIDPALSQSAWVGFSVAGSSNELAWNRAEWHDTGRGGFEVTGSSHTLRGNVARFNHAGYKLASATGTVLTGNVAERCREGFLLTSSTGNTLIANEATGDPNNPGPWQRGFWLNRGGDGNLLQGNRARGYIFGFCLCGGKSNTLDGNTAVSNSAAGVRLGRNGIEDLEVSTSNVLTRNWIRGNGIQGVRAIEECFFDCTVATGNLLYDNVLANPQNAVDEGMNSWSLAAREAGINVLGGAYRGGNAWSDYAGTDGDGDGIGDTAVPHDSSGWIAAGGDSLPLVASDRDADSLGDPFDNCPDAFNTGQLDSDLDGAGDACDCALSNPDVHPAASEINDGIDNQCPGGIGLGSVDETSGDSGFHSAGDPTQYSWTPQQLASLYEVARSGSPDFSSCVSWATSLPFLLDSEVPSADQVFFYLNRPVAPFPGSWGWTSAGAERNPLCMAQP